MQGTTQKKRTLPIYTDSRRTSSALALAGEKQQHLTGTTSFHRSLPHYAAAPCRTSESSLELAITVAFLSMVVLIGFGSVLRIMTRSQRSASSAFEEKVSSASFQPTS